jgi:uncharacterized protein (TIGR03545 family)
MFRWSYLIPRLVILGLIVLALWISADPLLKYAIVQSAESVTGSKVEVGKVKSSLLKGKVYLQELAVSDPRNPMQNLIQADVAYLQLNPQRLLHRQLVIEHGHSTQVMFGAPRTTSGELPDREYPFEDLKQWLPASLKDQVLVTTRAWMDKVQTNVDRNQNDNLEFVKVAKQIQQKWPAIFERKRAEISNIQNRISVLKQVISKPTTNPLRQDQDAEVTTAKIQAFQNQLNQARNEMAQLVKEANHDLDLVRQAKTQDAAKLNQYQASTLDADTFSNLLLADDQSKRMEEVINWVRWFRNSIPNPATDFRPTTNRGSDIVFQGQKRNPQFLIKTLELEGQGTVADQHFDFAGIAKNISTEPNRHDQPVTFELRAQGEHHLIVNCTLDRRNDVWKDKMVITCPDLEIPEQNFGDGHSLVVQNRPSRMQANVHIEIVGNQLSGNLEFRHSNCSLYVEKIDESAGGQDMQLRMNQELAQVKQFSTFATLGGTLEEPSITFRSDLGQQFAAGMNRIVKDQADQRVVDINLQLDQRYQQEVQELNQMLQLNFREIAQVLNGESTIVAELIESIPDENDWRRR